MSELLKASLPMSCSCCACKLSDALNVFLGHGKEEQSEAHSWKRYDDISTNNFESERKELPAVAATVNNRTCSTQVRSIILAQLEHGPQGFALFPNTTMKQLPAYSAF